MPSTHRAYAFGEYVADTVTRRLSRAGRPVAITSKTFEVLAVLLEHRDRLVSKDELLDRVWPDTTVQENNLARQVSSLRRALGERPEEGDYVLTVPGQGYRFVADVQEIVEPPAPGVDAEPAAAIERPTPRWGVAGAVAVVTLLLALGFATVLLRPRDPGAEVGRTLQRVTYDAAGLSRDGSWSPDGQWIVFVSERGGHTDLWKQRIGDPDPVRLTNSEAGESEPEWSPDGRWIAFRSERDGGGLYLMPADGGYERPISGFGYEPRWSPDSTQILFKRSVILPDLPTIYVASVDGRPPQPVRPEVMAEFTALHAAWHPDGRRVSAWGTDKQGNARFLNVPLDRGEPTPVHMTAAILRQLATITPRRFVWARSGKFIYFEGTEGDTRNVWRLTAHPSSEALTDGPVRLTTGTGQEAHVAVSPDGTRLLFTSSTSRTRLWAFPLDSSSARIVGDPLPITDGSTGEVDFDARADGSKVAYRMVRAGRNELWERSLGDGTERLLLSSPDAKLVKPRWSPDGAKLAFLRCGRGSATPVLAVANTDGSGERALTRPGGLELLASDWSHDGESILGSCRFRSSDRYSTCVLPVSGTASHARVIASDPTRNLFNQRFSPDQRWIVFLAHDLMYTATSTVYVIPAEGGGWRAITDGGAFDDKPRWGPDGRVLYYVSDRDGVKNVWGRRFDPSNGSPIGEPFAITSFRAPQFLISSQAVQMDIAITSTHLMIPMSESRGDLWMLEAVDR